MGDVSAIHSVMMVVVGDVSAIHGVIMVVVVVVAVSARGDRRCRSGCGDCWD